MSISALRTTEVTHNECVSIRHLRADGWSVPELADTLEYDHTTISRHINAKCDHVMEMGPQTMDLPSGESIRQRRLEADLTQQELAAELDVTPSTVSQWENDVMSPRKSRILHIERIFRAKGVSW